MSGPECPITTAMKVSTLSSPCNVLTQLLKKIHSKKGEPAVVCLKKDPRSRWAPSLTATSREKTNIWCTSERRDTDRNVRNNYCGNCHYNIKEVLALNIKVRRSGLFRKFEIYSFGLMVYTEEVHNTDELDARISSGVSAPKPNNYLMTRKEHYLKFLCGRLESC